MGSEAGHSGVGNYLDILPPLNSRPHFLACNLGMSSHSPRVSRINETVRCMAKAEGSVSLQGQ